MSTVIAHRHWSWDIAESQAPKTTRRHAPHRTHRGVLRGTAFTLAAAAVGALTLLSGVASPLTPLAKKTLAVEHAQDLAAIWPASSKSDYAPPLYRMMPMLGASAVGRAQCPTATPHTAC